MNNLCGLEHVRNSQILVNYPGKIILEVFQMVIKEPCVRCYQSCVKGLKQNKGFHVINTCTLRLYKRISVSTFKEFRILLFLHFY